MAEEPPHKTIRDEESLRFVHCLSNRNHGVRTQAFDSILRVFDALIGGHGSPPDLQNGITPINRCRDMKEMIDEYLIDILRLSKQCPFEDVLEKCKELLIDMQVRINHLNQS